MCEVLAQRAREKRNLFLCATLAQLAAVDGERVRLSMGLGLGIPREGTLRMELLGAVVLPDPGFPWRTMAACTRLCWGRWSSARAMGALLSRSASEESKAVFHFVS